MGFSMPSSAHGATNVWSTTFDFTEFMGQPGGFDDDSAGRVELHSNANPGPQARSYDVLRAQGVDGATGRTIFGQGQDGTADMTITTRVFNGNQGRWGSLAAEKRLGDYRSSVSIASGERKSGDFGVVAYEFSFSSALQITADSFMNGRSSRWERLVMHHLRSVNSQATEPPSTATSVLPVS